MSQYGEQLNLFNQDDNSHSYFTKKRSWSASKHRIMLKYIQSFCYNLGGNKGYQSSVLNYVDGFAGEGKYDEGIGIRDFIDGSEFWQRYESSFSDTDGSPLIALKCSQIFAQENRVNLRCFFSEAKKKNHQQLQKNCQSVTGNLDYKIYDSKPFTDCLSEIVEDLQGYPTLFFLDAFAVKGLDFTEIVKICNYLTQYKGELFLLFHNRQVARCAGQSTPKSTKESAVKAAKTYTKNLTRLLGKDSEEEWKSKWLELRNSPQQFERWALNYFKYRLFNRTQIKGVASFEIKEFYDDNRPQYSIIVCSNHPQKAFGEFLNEFIADENQLLFYQETSDKNITRFLDHEWQKETSMRKQYIKNRVLELLVNDLKQWLSVKNAITMLILRFGQLGYLKRKEYRIIFIELYHEKKFQARNLGKKNELTLKSEIKIV
ncbi:MAG: three-Cys-motif partner protein TcmP [Microcystaceae cyanobacterium]